MSVVFLTRPAERPSAAMPLGYPWIARIAPEGSQPRGRTLPRHDDRGRCEAGLPLRVICAAAAPNDLPWALAYPPPIRVNSKALLALQRCQRIGSTISVEIYEVIH